ncbi:MAG: zf-HC2 domain-containing protein, partial [Planctomycetota bacterium]|nr:zf-HC2 domain-containing protein [Planctomycetota bacterium]
MADDELKILLTGYLDGELDADDVARVERALAEDPELRAELEQTKGLMEMTEGLSLDERTDAEMEAFWGAVYNKL